MIQMKEYARVKEKTHSLPVSSLVAKSLWKGTDHSY